MEDVYKQNMELVRRRWPAMAAAIEQQPVAEVVWANATPILTMEVGGLRIHSGYQPLEEAELQLRHVPMDAPVMTIYGIGMGFLPRIALEVRPDTSLRILPLNLSVFKASLAAIDHQAWLGDPRCELVEPQTEKNVSKPFAAIPACLQFAAEGLERLRDQIILELNTPFLRRESSVSQAKRRQQIEDNLGLIAQDSDVQELFDQSVGTVLIAAAGPTLKQSLNWIRDNRSRARLIAVDAALRPLLDAGIVPDIVVAADAERENLMKYFRGDLSACGAVPLVYMPVVHHDVLSSWPGPRYTAYTDNPVYAQLKIRYPRASLFMSGSVAHCAVDLGVRMGAKSVVLLGCDFSYPGQAVHANPDVSVEQLLQQSNARSWVLDGYGNKILSAPNLMGYMRDLERYIEKHDELDWRKLTRAGAAISGVSYLAEDVSP